MTISVAALFERCRLNWAGAVQWGQQVPLDRPGIYVVASTADAEDSVARSPKYEPDLTSFSDLRRVCPEVKVDGQTATDLALAERLSAFWVQDSVVLYIGLAGTSVQKRVKQYYVTRIGQRSPHAGGWWLKTLSQLEDLYVHYAPAPHPETAETALLAAYADSVPSSVRTKLFDPERIAPFANVNVRHGLQKRHGLAGYKIGRVTRTPTNSGAILKSAPAIKPPDAVPAHQSAPSKPDPANGICIESQVITDADRSRSNLRIPARSKHALPAADAFLTLNYGGTKAEVRWRVNGSRSGTIGIGKSLMQSLGSPGQSVWLTVRGTLVEIEP